jgi:DNA-binding phage protein
MTKTTTTILDPAAHLTTTDDVAAYLEAALQDGIPSLSALYSMILLEPKA